MHNSATLRIASFNTWSGCIPGTAGNRDYIVNFIVELADSCDYLVLHEVHVSSDKQLERFVTTRSPGHRPGPLDLKLGNRVQERLKTSHHMMFAPHFRVTALHDYEATALPVYYGNLVLIKRSVTVLRNEVAMIYGIGDINGEIRHKETGFVTGRAGSRKANVTTIDTGYGPLTIAGVHGLHSRAGKVDSPARMAQSAQIGHAIASQRKRLKLPTDDPLSLVIGDLNLTSTNEALKQLQENQSAFGLHAGVNLNHEYKIVDTRTKWYPKTKPSREASFALVSQPLRGSVESYQINTKVCSDHGLGELVIAKRPGT